ncbi:hypothetical protein F5X99DRAFT_409570 [Biscogniauxia marginata]|nr:hypothetical protein F5X99DRAFT_409570 [Biscogniauxia marginata]
MSQSSDQDNASKRKQAQLDPRANPNYLGNPKIKDNWTEDIPNGQNTSLWITGLPSDCTYHILLGAIRGAGNIKSSHINSAQDDLPSCAAKIVFFTHEAAERVYKAAKAGKLPVQGVHPQVSWNRIRTSEDLHPADRTRVLRIEGPENIVNKESLERFWKSFMWWHVDEVLDIGEVRDGICVVWYRFGSWRCQAELAKKILEKVFPNRISVTYQPDYCAQGGREEKTRSVES